jgi:membrane-associated protease RseP (regulator of RpoE activity)
MKQRYPLHIFLFLVTVFTTLMAGTEWATGKSFFRKEDLLTFDQLWRGIPFSFSFLLFLTVHEFGHYFTAVYHRVRCSLPYYIPIFIPIPMVLNIGSFGAVIRIREVPSSRRKYFDIGVAGPLAGFVVAVGLLVVGFTQLPPVEETVYAVHTDYEARFGGIPTEAQLAGEDIAIVDFGRSLLFEGMKWLFRNEPDMPPWFEMQHYPLLVVGFLTLFFTALNLLPIGQLDGGHVMYGLFGAKRAGMISRIAVLCLMLVGGMGFFTMRDFALLAQPMPWYERLADLGITVLYVAGVFEILRHLFKHKGWAWLALGTVLVIGFQFVAALLLETKSPNLIWLLYAFLAVRLIGLDHPVAPDDTPLSTRQKVLGWLAIVVFILCFSPSPILIRAIGG